MLTYYLSLLNSTDPEDDLLLTRLYEEHGALAVHVAKGILHDRNAAEDIAHDAFVYMAEHFAGLDRSSLENLRAYLLRCVVSRAINAYHMRRRESSYDEYVELQETDLGIRSGSAEDVMLDAERMNDMMEAVKALPAVNRIVLELHYEGWPSTKIAELMGTTDETARKRLERGRKKLWEEMHKE